MSPANFHALFQYFGLGVFLCALGYGLFGLLMVAYDWLRYGGK